MSLQFDAPSTMNKLSLAEDDIFSPSAEEPELEGGLRHLSVSSDGTIDSIVSADETPTPPQSPTPVVHITPPSHRHSSSISRELMDSFTPESKQQTNSFHTPEPPILRAPVVLPDEVVLTPPTPPRLRKMQSSGSLTTASPESPGLLARRAANGKLPNKALLSLQQMRFESNDAGMGLGVGPGSAGYEGLDSPSQPGSAGPGMTFRLALGLEGKDAKGATSPGAVVAADDLENAPASPLGGAPTLLRQRSWGRSAPINRLPQTPDGIKIPPTLRGSKILDKLNLSPPPALSSPLSASPRDRTAFSLANGPPSPLVMRSSAFVSYGSNGPLTPLTPSHVPGAPSLGSDMGYFGVFSDMCATPGADSSLSPTRNFFLPSLTPDTPPHRGGHTRMAMPASPLGRPEQRNHNPFFAPA